MKSDSNSVITVVAKQNPARSGTGHWKRFNLYKNGMTIAEYVAKGGHRGDIGWDVERGFITITKPEAVAAKPEKTKKNDPAAYTLRKLRVPKPAKKAPAQARQSA